MEQIVDTLKARRIAAGVSIKELAYKMKTSPARVSEIEHGKGGYVRLDDETAHVWSGSPVNFYTD